MIYLNLGCGNNGTRELHWVNLDRSYGTRGFPTLPHVIADVRDLPYDDASVDAVYCGCLLPHLELETVPQALAEMRRVLKPEGRFAVVGPDFEVCQQVEPETAHVIWPGIEGEWSSWEGAKHLWCSTGPATLGHVLPFFPSARMVPIPELDPFWPAPDRRSPWVFAIEAA